MYIYTIDYIYLLRHIIFKLTKYKDSGWTWRITSHVFTRPWCLWHLGLLLTTIRLQAPYTTYQIVSFKGYLKNQHIFAPQEKHDFHMMNNVHNFLDLPHYEIVFFCQKKVVAQKTTNWRRTKVQPPDPQIRNGNPSRFAFGKNGELSHSNGKSPCFMGKSTISMAMFNSYVSLPEGNPKNLQFHWCLDGKKYSPSTRSPSCHGWCSLAKPVMVGWYCLVDIHSSQICMVGWS